MRSNQEEGLQKLHNDAKLHVLAELALCCQICKKVLSLYNFLLQAVTSELESDM